ncbi:MAG TPA: DUF5752 family protein [Candidatus Sulfotelmatobacter sp.]|jgi:hypothetical protein|nr:DUF5752 family protein [Candidatus Sulfotelmatobacter sp.]
MTTATVLNPSLTRNPAKPFYFNTSAHLLRITRQKANSLGEFLDALRECPEASIFQHSFRTLQEHHFIREGFSNDFAHWAVSACNEPSLAEGLASVDVREFTSVKDLRERFIQIVGEFLQRTPAAAQRAARETFYFCASESVVIPTNFVAHTLKDFAEGLRGVTVHCIHHHFIEARLRLKLMSNDFSQWLYEDMGLIEAARQLNQIDVYTLTMEDVRNRIVRIVERALI